MTITIPPLDEGRGTHFEGLTVFPVWAEARQRATVPLEDGGDARLARRVPSTRGVLRVPGIAVSDGLDRIIHLAVFGESHALLENA